MTMTTTPRTLVLDVDRELLEHRAHLPETESCICGYRRPAEAAQPGTLAA